VVRRWWFEPPVPVPRGHGATDERDATAPAPRPPRPGNPLPADSRPWLEERIWRRRALAPRRVAARASRVACRNGRRGTDGFGRFFASGRAMGRTFNAAAENPRGVDPLAATGDLAQVVRCQGLRM